tara:strand:+ start:511 stop:885 length:375 start_codon:yes stop_codon:yes gene_type:complete
MNKENKLKYVEALDSLMSSIKKDYAGWGSDIDSLDEPQKSIRLKMIDEFNNSINVRSGRKFDKVVSNGSVWGFVAKTDGVLKGIPYFVGDVFKAAGWRAPAKHVRGSIFSSKTNWFSWTGPRYL